MPILQGICTLINTVISLSFIGSINLSSKSFIFVHGLAFILYFTNLLNINYAYQMI